MKSRLRDYRLTTMKKLIIWTCMKATRHILMTGKRCYHVLWVYLGYLKCHFWETLVCSALQPTSLCKLNISQLKRPDSLPSIQQELHHPTFIDIHRMDVMGNSHIVPVRKCVSAKVGKETMGRHTRARMDARRHKRCMQRSAARQIAASNWKNFTATEFEIAPIYTLK